MKKQYLQMLAGVVAVLFMASGCASLPQKGEARHLTGDIKWVDVQEGKLRMRGETIVFRVTQNDTRVTDPKDKQFLTVKDLKAGQRVAIDYFDMHTEPIAQKIIIESMPAVAYEDAYGEVQAIDGHAGTMTIDERPDFGEWRRGNLSSFVFDPNTILVMRSPRMEPVRTEVRPGDDVKIEFMMKDGQKDASSIVLYSRLPKPLGARTTTTTTTSVTTVK